MTVQSASRRLAPVAIALAFLALAVSSAFAQNTSGSLTGTVVDQSGAVVVGADITLTNEASRDVRRTKSNADGYFTFAAVPPSTYSVSIETPGFSKYEQKGIALRIGASQSLRTIKLDVAGMAEEATVTASIDLAPLNSGEKSATLTSEQILNFSTVGRSAAELLKVLPGMTPTTGVNNRPQLLGRGHRASTATARAGSRARPATTPPTEPAPRPSTSPSTERRAPIRAATARPRSTPTPRWWRSSRCSSRTSGPSTRRAPWPCRWSASRAAATSTAPSTPTCATTT